jgi:proteasome lid subunit RPN8/RPN11
MTLRLRLSDYEAMLAQLQAAYPLEACGLMAGRNGTIRRIYPVANRLASPYAFEMEPVEQVQAMLDLEERGLELLAIYHSHPQGPAGPSASDVARAFYPEAAQLIVSLRDREHPTVRAFSIADGRVGELSLQIV